MSTTSTTVLRHASAFIDELLSNTDLRLRLLSSHTLPSKTTTKTLTIASQTLESAISTTTTTTTTTTSLRLAEKLLLSLRSQTPQSALLLSLIYALCHRPLDAALSLLDVFIANPNLSRSEIAPSVFENLFLHHLLPVVRWFTDRRSHLIPSSAAEDRDDGRSVSMELGAVLMSRMSGDQAAELRGLEREYEEALDENTRAYAMYLKEVLRGSDGEARSVSPPPLILNGTGDGGGNLEAGGDRRKMEFPVADRRYNPIWIEGEQSVEFLRNCSDSKNILSKWPTLIPQRVPPHLLTHQGSPAKTDSDLNSSSDTDPDSPRDNNSMNSFESEPEVKPNKTQVLEERQNSSANSNCSSNTLMEDSDHIIGSEKQTPPKDFICPITSQLFVDPVTLETGQTYERKAVQEWIDRGNSTCPITRHRLKSTQLPKTNYVLKRLIASWKEQNPCPVPVQSETPPPKPARPLSSLTSVISQASTDGTTGELREAISRLSMSEILSESEAAVLQIEHIWREASVESSEIVKALAKPAVVNGFVEMLFNSVEPRVLRATVFLLSELVFKDETVLQTLTRVDSDVACVVSLFKKGLVEASVLIYTLRPSWESLVMMDMVDALLMAIKTKGDDSYEMCVKPKTASVLLLAQVLNGEEDSNALNVAGALISERAVESVVGSLEAEPVEERLAAVTILLRCMEQDGRCRNTIADKAELAPVLESFMNACDGERFEIIRFLFELVKLNRQQFRINAPLWQAEPRKMSMYREEAIDVLISSLRNSESISSQIVAAETIMSLQGRFSSSGKPLARAFLLKRAGMGKRYRALMRAEQMGHAVKDSEENLEEEKATDAWERKTAYVLVSHEFGLIFEALAEGLKSRHAQLSSACLVSAAWLTHMLAVLPDTGLRGAARVCLLKRFVSIFKSARDDDDKALAMLALRSFMYDSEGLQDLALYMKDILKTLRELRKSSSLAHEMLKLLSEGHDSSVQELWNHKELAQVECSMHGEVLSITCYKNYIISGHSDGTMKVWSGKDSLLHLLQETQDHSKAVTSLEILQSGEKLYSGSLDRSLRVWSIGEEGISCIEVHDMKDQVHDLRVTNTISCFIPQGAGVKVFSWSGGSKLLNPKQNVKCLALVQGKLYCGCNDSSIQEIDLTTGTIGVIQMGSRKLLGKANPIHAMKVQEGLLYAAGGSLDGSAVKIWSTSTSSVVGSLPTTMEVRSMTISTELIYLGSKMGAIEIWSRDKLSRVGTLQTGTNAKVLCMAVDDDGELLVIGTSDGRIQAWGLT
ncbi:putative E3 ubiquitin-protein ligase LIN-1 [Acorus gramineus]|uniref:RING-type E3 ubiquitin transferase n=1 Tax=Acorus gramineus TaxID=55184 RepID=A0AAV9APP5_ACOGR|nr:putative E3 ubiquitin-protein ligase LIN-1 [Acorus gramineus]